MKADHELAMVVAFYLSKFGTDGLHSLGYQSYRQAFDQIGSQLNVNPNSVKNWRDEFDPYYDNERKGWHQRNIRPSRRAVMLAFDDLSETALRAVVKDIVNPEVRPKVESELQATLSEIKDSDRKRRMRASVEYAPRGPTGRMAEEFFVSSFRAGSTPFLGTLADRRDDGVGFDFEIIASVGRALVEIKGVAGETGGISFTDKEWQVAIEAQESYHLGLVTQVLSSPRIGFVRNPACALTPAHYAYTTVTVTWRVSENQLVGVLKS